MPRMVRVIVAALGSIERKYFCHVEPNSTLAADRRAVGESVCWCLLYDCQWEVSDVEKPALVEQTFQSGNLHTKLHRMLKDLSKIRPDLIFQSTQIHPKSQKPAQTIQGMPKSSKIITKKTNFLSLKNHTKKMVTPHSPGEIIPRGRRPTVVLPPRPWHPLVMTFT